MCAGLLFLMLAACTQSAGYTPGERSFRNPDAPFGATTRFDPVAFAGSWTIVASFAGDARGVLQFAYDPATGAMTQNGLWSGRYSVSQPGVLTPKRAGGQTLVVMWVDTGFRTAAIGTRDGRFGAVINRGAGVPKDRLRAAKDILEFYGWDISRLVEVKT